MKFLSAIAGWKVWGIIFAAGSFVVFGTLKYIGYLRRKAAALQAHVASVEKRSAHKVAVTEADREGAQNAAEKVEKAVEKARTGDRSHFE